MTILSLWLPIVLSAIAVWLLSSLVWMVFPHHKSDFKGLPNEDEARGVLKNTPPGSYTVPYFADRAKMGEPEGLKKYQDGPVMTMTVLPKGPPQMVNSLVMWLVFCLTMGVLVAYLLTQTLPSDASTMKVMQIASTVAWMGYGAACTQRSVWFGDPWSNTLKLLADGLLYGLTTGVIFSLLW